MLLRGIRRSSQGSQNRRGRVASRRGGYVARRVAALGLVPWIRQQRVRPSARPSPAGDQASSLSFGYVSDHHFDHHLGLSTAIRLSRILVFKEKWMFEAIRGPAADVWGS